MTTRRQHYVWRHYISKWGDADKLVWCLRDGRIFQTNAINVMVERDFYQLHRLTQTDIVVIKTFMIDQTGSPHLRTSHENLLNHFVTIAELNEYIQRHPNTDEDAKSRVRTIIIETEEKLHGAVEREAMPVLDLVVSQSADILLSDDHSFVLLYFLLMQYFRTRTMREQMSLAMQDMLGPDSARRVANLVCQFAAVNVAGTLFRDRLEFELIYLNSPSDGAFITGDQPVVNLLGKNDNSPAEEFVLYYPVTPELAIVLAPKKMQLKDVSRCFSSAQQAELNDFMASRADSMLIAKSRDHIEQFRSSGPRPSSVPISFVPCEHAQPTTP